MRAAFLGLGVVAAFSLGVTAFEWDAAACGGCFHMVGENDSPVTTHQMVFSISSQQTTLYDQIELHRQPEFLRLGAPHRRASDRRSELASALHDARQQLCDHDHPAHAELPRASGGLLLRRRRGRAGDQRRGGRRRCERPLQSGRRPVPDGAAPVDRPERAHRLAYQQQLQHPLRDPAHHHRVRERGLRLPCPEAPPQRRRQRHAPRARHDARRDADAPSSHGGRRHRRHRGHHPVGRRRRAL